MLIVPTIGAGPLLDDLLGDLNVWYHLYVNDATLSVDTVLTDLTEATWTGYVPKKVSSWTPALASAGIAAASADPLIWTIGSVVDPSDVYGYYTTDGQDGPLLWVEAAQDGPIPMREVGAKCLVMPGLTLSGLGLQ